MNDNVFARFFSHRYPRALTSSIMSPIANLLDLNTTLILFFQIIHQDNKIINLTTSLLTLICLRFCEH
ncbi:hypothetical protein HanIR_Chr11g0538611 [Helianthus annuus]|nr:hypothetical protein HanIR_Chr11g0538611 [Helianthus annuus]